MALFLYLRADMKTQTPPHVVLEEKNRYSIVFNLLGTSPQDVGIRISESGSEFTVLARKRTVAERRAFFWTFNVPKDGFASGLTARFERGVLEVLIPKQTVLAA